MNEQGSSDSRADCSGLVEALQGIATNSLKSSTNKHPQYAAGVSHGLGIAADMARKALEAHSNSLEHVRQSPQGSVPAIGALTTPAALGSGTIGTLPSNSLDEIRAAYKALANDPPNSITTMRALTAMGNSIDKIERLRSRLDKFRGLPEHWIALDGADGEPLDPNYIRRPAPETPQPASKDMVERIIRTVKTWPVESPPTGTYQNWIATLVGEIEQLRAELAKWQANCTGKHGSQASCVDSPPSETPQPQPASKQELAEALAEWDRIDVLRDGENTIQGAHRRAKTVGRLARAARAIVTTPETCEVHPDKERLDWMDSAQADVEYSYRKGEPSAYPEVNAPAFPWARRKTIREAIDAARAAPKAGGMQTSSGPAWTCSCGQDNFPDDTQCVACESERAAQIETTPTSASYTLKQHLNNTVSAASNIWTEYMELVRIAKS